MSFVQAPRPIYRKDYQPPPFTIDRVDLRFELGEETTRVTATLALRRLGAEGAALVLEGEALRLVSVALGGRALAPGEYAVDAEHLTIPDPGAAFELTTVVEIRPQDNTELSGLYRSSGNFCTQCEAEGFRRITYFVDRPDVMARYEVTIEAPREACPVLLSNGNLVERRELPEGRHLARWVDPFPKPSYLFALVAGRLSCFSDRFVTRSGREVRLELWVEPHNLDRCEHAMRSLKRAMRWDEEAFGREYDLDIYMIVAVSDFNMGAMENKGLNIFNAKYVLARPDTATDDDYEQIEGVIGHEYFHNWTGNRVTCRDWFQLTLKEGLTVLRDQLFSADMGSPAALRIADVLQLRTAQFAEDSGPMAHPIRPESYIKMDNFYTTTVYEKGAEVIRMMRTLLGPAGFRRGMDLYFERHDGQAVTCDDFRAAMADAGGRDLEQFGRWYSQAGTPVVRARGAYDAAAAAYTLTLEQAPPRGREGEPLHIPVAVGLVDETGASLPLRLAGEPAAQGETRVLELRERAQEFRFVDVPRPPVASLLRGFSAPVLLEVDRSDDDLALLMASDPDPFSRWDAGQELGRRVLLRLAGEALAGRPLALDPRLVDACARTLADPRLDGSLKALALALPSERIVGQHQEVVAVDALNAARRFVVRALASALREPLLAAYRAGAPRGPYSQERAEVDRRRLRNLALSYLVALGDPELVDLAVLQFEAADNMTDSQEALACLIEHGGAPREAALARFYERWRGDPLVIDKWFALQAASDHPDTLERVLALARHPDFTLANPNRARSLVGTFGLRNQFHFHRPCGRGYAFLADQVLALDPHNSQVAARLVAAFNPWRRFDAARQGLIGAQLERIAGTEGLSSAVREIVERALAPV